MNFPNGFCNGFGCKGKGASRFAGPFYFLPNLLKEVLTVSSQFSSNIDPLLLIRWNFDVRLMFTFQSLVKEQLPERFPA